MHSVSALPDHISDARGEISQAKFDELLSSDALAESLILWYQFLSYLRHGNLSTFWMSYGDMVGDILFRLVRIHVRRARQEVVIGNFTSLPSGKCFHGTLPMTD